LPFEEPAAADDDEFSFECPFEAFVFPSRPPSSTARIGTSNTLPAVNPFALACGFSNRITSARVRVSLATSLSVCPLRTVYLEKASNRPDVPASPFRLPDDDDDDDDDDARVIPSAFERTFLPRDRRWSVVRR
jgi:hypothetical protein